MSVNRVDLFYKLEKTVCGLFAKEKLDLNERGNLAMAVQALESPEQAERLCDALERCKDQGDVSGACYRILRCVYRDWSQRIKASTAPGYAGLVEQLWWEREKAGNAGRLKSYVLTRRLEHYPEYFTALLTMEKLI